MKKLAVIGQYGTGPLYLTGQAVKTVFITDWMKRHYGEDQVEIVNTYGWKKHPLSLVLNVFRAMKHCSNVMIFPAPHGVKIFPGLVSAFNRLLHRRTFFIVIGGWLADFLKKHSYIRRATKKFYAVCAETESLVQDLKNVGIEKAVYLPNCRDYVDFPKTKDFERQPLHVCTYSRVTQSKGIEDAVETVCKANKALGKDVFFLDVFGSVDSAYKEDFEKLCSQNSSVMAYAGTRDADQTLQTLKECFALLFPTWYEGECFAGTVLDAFLSRTPIIANDWKFNSQVIRDKEDGFLYPYRDTTEAAKLLVSLYEDRQLYNKIQDGCAESALRYSSDNVLGQLAEQMK